MKRLILSVVTVVLLCQGASLALANKKHCQGVKDLEAAEAAVIQHLKEEGGWERLKMIRNDPLSDEDLKGGIVRIAVAKKKGKKQPTLFNIAYVFDSDCKINGIAVVDKRFLTSLEWDAVTGEY